MGNGSSATLGNGSPDIDENGFETDPNGQLYSV